MAATKTTFTATGNGNGDWTPISGAWSVMRSGGSGTVILKQRAAGTTDEFAMSMPVEAGTYAGASVGASVVEVRFVCIDYQGTPIVCQVVQ